MQVWRVEDNDGLGPYSAVDFQHFTDYVCENDPDVPNHSALAHPSPWNDGYLAGETLLPEGRKLTEMVFGFDHRARARDWFGVFGPRARQWLDDHGFRVSIYDVPNQYVKCFHRQVVFLRERAQLVRTLPIDELF